MSTQTIHSILNRAVQEASFRSLLFSDPETALAGYDLTDAEAAALKNLTPENFDAASGDLEARISRAAPLNDPDAPEESITFIFG